MEPPPPKKITLFSTLTPTFQSTVYGEAWDLTNQHARDGYKLESLKSKLPLSIGQKLLKDLSNRKPQKYSLQKGSKIGNTEKTFSPIFVFYCIRS